MYSINRMCLNPGDIVRGRYQIIDILGRGGFGTTYRAEDNYRSANPRVVVIKEILISQTDSNEVRNSNYLERLEREADTLRDLEHFFIPKFFESFTEENYYYIIQEYVKGHDLGGEIRPGEPIEEAAVVSILREMLEILRFVHGQNIIHRDLKPANIIRRHSDNRLVLIDFGAVKEIATEHTDATGRTLTAIIHTPGYAPPEQLVGAPGFSSDIYALGIIAMQGVTGFAIRAIENCKRIPKRDDRCNYVWEEYAPQIDPEYRKIISRMIEYDLGDRYQNVEEILQDLDRVIKPEPTKFFPPVDDSNIFEKLFSAFRQFYVRHRRKIIFIATVVVTCLLLIFLFKPANNTCALNPDDNISCGEKILDPLSKGAIRSRAAEHYEDREYLAALKYYQDSWQKERRDAETLIYLNNALLDANKIKAYKIAVAVPFTSDETNEIKSSSVAQDFLRGVAQAQTEVNLSLSKFSPAIKAELSQYDFLPHREIASVARNKGLKVIIADDANNKKQAINTATKIVEKRDLLGVVGHYTSGMTLSTVDIYGQHDIPLISYGTTTKELTENPRDNFFRVVYSNEEEAGALVEYIEQNDLSEKKIAIFYNPSSEYSNRFKIELKDKITNLNNSNISIVKEFDLANENFYVSTALAELDKLGVNICILMPDGQITNSLDKAIKVLKQDNGKRLMLGGNPLIHPKVKQLDSQPLNLVVATFWHPTANPESEFNRQTEQLWGSSVNGGTAMAYDATLTLVEAIRHSPTRKGTIEQLSAEDFSVSNTATGEITFNASKNGDRENFAPTLVRLVECKNSSQFADTSLDKAEAFDLICQGNL